MFTAALLEYSEGVGLQASDGRPAGVPNCDRSQSEATSHASFRPASWSSRLTPAINHPIIRQNIEVGVMPSYACHNQYTTQMLASKASYVTWKKTCDLQ